MNTSLQKTLLHESKMNIPLQGKEFMKRSPGNISKSDPSTVPAVDLTEVRIDIFVCGHFLFF